MLRVVLLNILLFFLPLILYSAYVLLVRGETAESLIDNIPVVWLLGIGLGLFLIAMVALVSFQGGDPGAEYHPPVYEDGVIRPGHID